MGSIYRLKGSNTDESIGSIFISTPDKPNKIILVNPTYSKEFKETEKLYNGQCRVCFYINPKYKKMLKEQSLKHGSLSKVCSDIIKQHFKAYK